MNLDNILENIASHIRKEGGESRVKLVVGYMTLFKVESDFVSNMITDFESENYINELMKSYRKAVDDIENGYIQHYIDFVQDEIDCTIDEHLISKGKDVIKGLEYLACE